MKRNHFAQVVLVTCDTWNVFMLQRERFNITLTDLLPVWQFELFLFSKDLFPVWISLASFKNASSEHCRFYHWSSCFFMPLYVSLTLDALIIIWPLILSIPLDCFLFDLMLSADFFLSAPSQPQTISSALPGILIFRDFFQQSDVRLKQRHTNKTEPFEVILRTRSIATSQNRTNLWNSN